MQAYSFGNVSFIVRNTLRLLIVCEIKFMCFSLTFRVLYELASIYLSGFIP